MRFELGSGTRKGCFFFNPLSYNAPKALIIPHKFKSAYFFDSIAGIVGRLINLVKDTYNYAVGYLGESCRNKTEKQCHRTFSNLILKGKWREAVWFIYGREKGGFLQPDELTWYRTYTINKTVELVLEGKHPSETISSCDMLEIFEEMPIFITVSIMEEAVESVARKSSESSGPGGTDS